MADNQAVPNIFANQSGNVPASQLDVNFATVLDAGTNRITASGSANTYIATSSPAITGYIANQPFIITFPATNTGASTINFNGVGSTNLNKVTGGAEGALVAGDIIANIPYLVISDGTNYIVANPSSAQSSSKATNGYTYLPTGVLIQWGTTGTIAGGPGTTATITFPIAFPNNCFNVQVTGNSTPGGNQGQNGATTITTTNFLISNGASNSQTLTWLAIGD